jgi:PAS domain S-box-containing protein
MSEEAAVRHTAERGDDASASRELRYRLALDAARAGTWMWDPETDVVEWDEAMEACYGLEPGTFGGTFEEYLERVHPEDRAMTADLIAHARDTGSPLSFEHRAVWPDGSVHWLEARGRDVRDETGRLVGMVGVGIDIDERKELEAIREEAAALRASVDVATQLEQAERIAKLGSWLWDQATNVVTLSATMAELCETSARTMSGQEFRDLLGQLSHPDDRYVLTDAPTEALASRAPFQVEQRLAAPGGGWRTVLHRGEVVTEDGDVVGIRGTTQDVTEERETEEALLAAHDRLFRERRAVQVLQETLIRPQFPDVAGYDIAAHYRPANTDPEVGGDWYDAFIVPDGRVLLAIGDVSGHGIPAARLMAKLRHATRAYALEGARPGQISESLDRFIDHFATADEFATCALALLDPASGTAELVLAGHPPPLLVRGASAAPIESPAGAILGLGVPGRFDAKCELQLAPGDALVFFTDGLVERRGEAIDDRVSRLCLGIESHGDTESPDELVTRLIEDALQDGEPTDDMCVLAIRRRSRGEPPALR